MQVKSAEKPKSLIGKAFWILRNRPAEFAANLRSYFLFERTRLLRAIVGSFFGYSPSQIQLEPGVRLQKLRCLRAEKPNAQIRIGAHSIVYENADVSAYDQATILIGACSILGDLKIASRFGIKIGQRFLSSWNVFIQDFDPHPVDPEKRAQQVEEICAQFRPRYSRLVIEKKLDWKPTGESIEIGDDVWIGANATILKGAKIGNGCIVATGAVVLAGDYPSRSLIAGNPARAIKQI